MLNKMKRRFIRPRREISLIILLKLIALFIIWLIAFSHPLSSSQKTDGLIERIQSHY